MIYLLLALGLFFIFARAVVWQIVLYNYSLSKVYPFNSLVQILILLYSYFLFNESIYYYHIIGVILMITGLFVISREK